jgi:integrase
MMKKPGTIDVLENGRVRLRMTIRGKQETIGYYDSEKDAELERDAMLAVEHEAAGDYEGKTVGDVGKTVLTRREVRKEVRDPRSDWSRWDTHIKSDPIARMGVRRIQPKDVTKWLRRLEDKGLKPQTRRNCLNILRTVLAEAHAEGAARINAAKGLRVKSGNDTEEAWTFLLPDEQTALLDAFEDDIRDIGGFAIGSGLRAGELVTLRLADVHVDGDRPHVVVRYGKPPNKPTKTKKVRHVPLFGMSLAAMKSWLERMPTLVKANPHGLAFPRLRGSFRSPEHVILWERWKGRPAKDGEEAIVGALERAGITRNVRWHDLRHTCASSLVSGWWGRRWSLEEVKEVLGHTSITITQRYAHLAPGAIDEAASETRAALVSSSQLGAPGPTRTDANPLRKRVLYPTELRGQDKKNQELGSHSFSRFQAGKLAADYGVTTRSLLAAVKAGDDKRAIEAARGLALLLLGEPEVVLAQQVLAGGPLSITRALELADVLGVDLSEGSRPDVLVPPSEGAS